MPKVAGCAGASWALGVAGGKAQALKPAARDKTRGRARWVNKGFMVRGNE